MVKKSVKKSVKKVETRNNSPVQKRNEIPNRKIEIPDMIDGELFVIIEGDSPLLVNNKLGVAKILDGIYGSGKGKSKNTGGTLRDLSTEERYKMAFYTLPSSKFDPPSPKGKYGVPTSGIKKCICSAIRPAGFTDNTTVGLIAKSLFVKADERGLCLLKFDKLIEDIRPVNIGSGAKSVPEMRHRPMFLGWSIKLKISYNPKLLDPDSICNLLRYAGKYIGLCELRAEKKQGECGGFIVPKQG